MSKDKENVGEQWGGGKGGRIQAGKIAHAKAPRHQHAPGL